MEELEIGAHRAGVGTGTELTDVFLEVRQDGQVHDRISGIGEQSRGDLQFFQFHELQLEDLAPLLREMESVSLHVLV